MPKYYVLFKLANKRFQRIKKSGKQIAMTYFTSS